MADTRQIVTWALEKTCALRNEKQATAPGEALTAVGHARAYSESLRNQTKESGIFGDIYVTSYLASESVPRKNCHPRRIPPAVSLFPRNSKVSAVRLACLPCAALARLIPRATKLRAVVEHYFSSRIHRKPRLRFSA
jgi:hypothetical protein